MELVHLVMDLVLPPILIAALLLVLPPYLLHKFFVTILKYFTMEDMFGKVVIITGASSGIGEYMAYEYAKKGARLTIVARREKQLKEVAEKARKYGSPDILCSCADVSKPEDCKRFVEETINRFGRLDHMVNNAGILGGFYFEEATEITSFLPIMNVNFWGSVYPTHYALPHLKKSKGKILVNASIAGWLYAPYMSIYGASKAALVNFYESLKVEFGSSVKITIASPGYFESEMTQGKHLNKDGSVKIDKAKIDNVIGMLPVRGVQECAKTIVNGVCRGDRYVTDPSWFRVLAVGKLFAPEVVEWMLRILYLKDWKRKLCKTRRRSEIAPKKSS